MVTEYVVDNATSAELSPVSTIRVDGPSWQVTGFQLGPSTRVVETGL